MRCDGCPSTSGGTCQSEGSNEAKLLILGMAPSRQDLASQTPFSGGTGKIIFDIVGKDVGLRRSNSKMVNLINCQPEGKNDEPSPAQLSACRSRVEGELRASAAEVVLALGSTAFTALTGIKRGGIESNRGYIFSPADCQPVPSKQRVVVGQYKSNCKGGKKGDPKYGWQNIQLPPMLPPFCSWIVPSLHPSSIMREGLKTLPCLKADTDRAIRLLAGAKPLEITFLSYPSSCEGAVAVDLETYSNGAIERVGMSDGKTTWTAPWGYDAAYRVRQELSQPEKWKIAHNWQFDMPKLQEEGIEVPGNIFDTMLAAHLIQPDLYKSLEKSSTLYLDLHTWKHLADKEPAYYNAADALISKRMFDAQWEILDTTGQLSLFTKTIMPATRVLMAMTKRGIRVDEQRLARWNIALGEKLDYLTREWQVATGGIDPYSPHKLRKYLYSTLGLKEQRSKYDRVTTDEAALAALRERHPEHRPMLSLLLQIRETCKLKSTYSTVAISGDGCVHPGYLPANKDTDRAGATTGRLASSQPNIQQLPNEARKMYVPHQERMVLVEADFSQIELRIAAALSQDRRLAAALLETDPFGIIMRLLGCDRVRSKNVLYGSLYGAGPRKLKSLLQGKGIETTEAECKQLQERLAQAYPDLWRWRTLTARTAVKERMLVNPFGRRRYFYAGQADIPAAIDFLPQSSAADILWSVLNDCEDMARQAGGKLLTTVHDSLLFECNTGGLGQFVDGLKETLQREWPQIAPGFRVPVKVKVGKSWGEMEDYDASRLDPCSVLQS